MKNKLSRIHIYLTLIFVMGAFYICSNNQELSLPKSSPLYLNDFLKPWEFGNPDELIEFEFENAELSSLITYIEKKFSLKFIMDDQLTPLPNGGKSALGTKISFRTYKPLSKKSAWDIFITFLDMAGLATAPGPDKGIYRITTTDPRSPLSVNKNALPSFIGIDPSLIPNNDTRIRYIYFVENTSLDVIKNVIDTMKSASSPGLIIFPELRALMMTDKGSNIKAILEVVKELDRVNVPETLSIIKLRRTDATKVADLYKSLVKDEAQQAGVGGIRLLGGRRQSTNSYFPEGTKVIAEPRTNTLILLGNKEAIKKIETFIIKEIDKELDVPFSPLHIYQLKYVAAEAMANILKEAIQFQTDTEAAKYGGVRDGDKYFKSLTITPEKTGNRLIINADYEDYLKLYEILQKIDVEQPQVAIKAMILEVDLTDTRNFGIQMRNKKPGPDGLLGNNVNYQTSGLAGLDTPVVENPNGTGATRLLGNLVSLASNDTIAGSTFVTLGSDLFGVWGMFTVLQSLTNVSIIANPFLITTHKYPASVSIGNTRRVITGTSVTPSGPINSFDDLTAKLEIYVEPQISYEGFIIMNVRIDVETFTDTATSSGNRIKREIKTSVIMADNEVLALGGIMRDDIAEKESKVPILGDIPVVGWFFKNKSKVVNRSSLVVLITPEVIPSYSEKFAERFTNTKINDAQSTLSECHEMDQLRDPIHRWFFTDANDTQSKIIDEFSSEQGRYIDPNQLKVAQSEHISELPADKEKPKKRITAHFEQKAESAGKI
ncbi:MAG: secretin N-terminal domain-containing protein [Candidatus Babeliaceae bacterium]|jgi:general secretion pathway protein D